MIVAHLNNAHIAPQFPTSLPFVSETFFKRITNQKPLPVGIAQYSIPHPLANKSKFSGSFHPRVFAVRARTVLARSDDVTRDTGSCLLCYYFDMRCDGKQRSRGGR